MPSNFLPFFVLILAAAVVALIAIGLLLRRRRAGSAQTLRAAAQPQPETYAPDSGLANRTAAATSRDGAEGSQVAGTAGAPAASVQGHSPQPAGEGGRPVAERPRPKKSTPAKKTGRKRPAPKKAGQKKTTRKK